MCQFCHNRLYKLNYRFLILLWLSMSRHSHGAVFEFIWPEDNLIVISFNVHHQAQDHERMFFSSFWPKSTWFYFRTPSCSILIIVLCNCILLLSIIHPLYPLHFKILEMATDKSLFSAKLIILVNVGFWLQVCQNVISIFFSYSWFDILYLNF